MTKKIRKAAKSKSNAADKILISMTGDKKMEPIKSSESGHASSKPKSNGSKTGKPKPGRLSVTDLKADTFVMTRKKADKPVQTATKTETPEIIRAEKVEAKGAVKVAEKQKSLNKAEKKTSALEKPGPKKQYIKSGKACKVTFRLPKAAAPDARIVTVVGDFNNWNVSETKMKKLKNGDFTTTLELHCNREYRFRYLIDSSRWENDWSADKYVRNRYGSDDSVVVIEGSKSA